MTVYVDELQDYGWKMRGHFVESCHMFTDSLDLTELHNIAAKAGMRREWFQQRQGDTPHYDLVAGRRALAVTFGAVEVDMDKAVDIWRARRELVKGQVTK